MNSFYDIGDQIEAAWQSKDYDESIFPSIASSALRTASLPERVDVWQILEWTLQQTELPRQRDVHARFGEPPITLYSGPRFHVDVYFWFHGTTSIHQHSFCGAFQVLHGSSIHSWYEFELSEKVNAFCEIGVMRLKSCELLNIGDVQEILPGRQYIHSLFHLDQPSVTIVVRTDKSPLFLPQFDYHKPGLAADPFFEHETTVKKLQSAGALLRAKRSDADAHISRLLESADFHTSYLILSAVYAQLLSSSIEQMFGKEESRRRFDALVNLVEKQRPGSDILRKVFTHRRRLEDLVRRRSFVENPEHRFFFALLLNVEGRELILALIRERFPESDPVEKILDWSYDLSQIRVAGTQNQNALGITPFDDFDLQLVDYLLHGKTNIEIADIIRETYPAEKAEQLLPTFSDRAAIIRHSIVFSPLMDNEN